MFRDSFVKPLIQGLFIDFSVLDILLTSPLSRHVFLPARHHVRHGVVGLLHGVHGPVQRAHAGLLLQRRRADEAVPRHRGVQLHSPPHPVLRGGCCSHRCSEYNTLYALFQRSLVIRPPMLEGQ